MARIVWAGLAEPRLAAEGRQPSSEGAAHLDEERSNQHGDPDVRHLLWTRQPDERFGA
jgi:hypothetical protein